MVRVKLRLLACGLATAALISCQGKFALDVQGSLKEVEFTLMEYPPATGAVELSELFVVDGTTERVIWHIMGSGEVARVRYGTLPTGFRSAQDPEPLSISRHYLVAAHTSPGWIVGGRSRICEFRLDEIGKVVRGPGCDEPGRDGD